jgi:hypothetical protein
MQALTPLHGLCQLILLPLQLLRELGKPGLEAGRSLGRPQALVPQRKSVLTFGTQVSCLASTRLLQTQGAVASCLFQQKGRGVQRWACKGGIGASF